MKSALPGGVESGPAHQRAGRRSDAVVKPRLSFLFDFHCGGKSGARLIQSARKCEERYSGEAVFVISVWISLCQPELIQAHLVSAQVAGTMQWIRRLRYFSSKPVLPGSANQRAGNLRCSGEAAFAISFCNPFGKPELRQVGPVSVQAAGMMQW